MHDARALVAVSKGREGGLWSWVNGLLARRPFNVVVAAVANKLARVAWHCSAAGRTTAPRRREYGFGKGRPPRARAGRPFPEGLPRAAGAVVEDGVSGRTGIGGARDSPRAEQPVVMTGSRSAELVGAGGRGPPRPDGWRQPRPERRTRQNPCGAGGVHGWMANRG